MAKINMDRLTQLTLALLPSNITIKTKLMLMQGLVLVGMGGMMVVEHFTSDGLVELQEDRILIHDIEAGMLTLRRNEKDFLARNNLKHDETAKQNTNTSESLAKLASDLNSMISRFKL